MVATARGSAARGSNTWRSTERCVGLPALNTTRYGRDLDGFRGFSKSTRQLDRSYGRLNAPAAGKTCGAQINHRVDFDRTNLMGTGQSKNNDPRYNAEFAAGSAKRSMTWGARGNSRTGRRSLGSRTKPLPPLHVQEAISAGLPANWSRMMTKTDNPEFKDRGDLQPPVVPRTPTPPQTTRVPTHSPRKNVIPVATSVCWGGSPHQVIAIWRYDFDI